MRAKLVNEAIKHLPGYSSEEIYDKYERKFRLNSFKKSLNKYTKENIEDNLHLDDYDIEDGKIVDWQYYYHIGNVIAQFIDKFYPADKHPEWGPTSLPTGETNQFHPTIIKIIDDWLLKEFPNWTQDDNEQFWEAITDYIGSYR